MKATVNLQLLHTTRFDSGSLGLMAMVIHPFSQSGSYRGTVLQHGQAAADFVFIVDEKSDAMQLDVDLATINRGAKSRTITPECDCKSDAMPALLISPKGYVLFHASSGAGYAVLVADAKGKPVFDSTELNKGDLFALTLLEPAPYIAKNTLGKSSAEITISLPTELKQRLQMMEAVRVSVDGRKLTPDHIQLTSTQGLIFDIQENARIVIEKKSSGSSKPVRDEGIKAHWQKFNPEPTTKRASARVKKSGL